MFKFVTLLVVFIPIIFIEIYCSFNSEWHIEIKHLFRCKENTNKI